MKKLAIHLMCLAASFVAGSAAAEAMHGVADGRIHTVRVSDGTMTVHDGESVMTFRATPGQLRRYQAGQRATLSYAEFGGSRWLLTPESPMRDEHPRRAGSMAGEVRRFDAASGVLTLARGGREVLFHAHPLALEALEKGQTIDVRYEAYGDDAWVEGIHVEPATGGSGDDDE